MKMGILYKSIVPEKIAEIDNIKKLEIDARINAVISNQGGGKTYDDVARKYIEELEKTETIVPTGSVHNAVRTLLMSVYFRKKDKFANMSDEEKFQYVVDWDRKKALQANRPAYIDANAKKLQELWEGIKQKYQDVRQKQYTITDNDVKTISIEPPEETGIELTDEAIKGLGSLFSKFEEGLLYKIFSFFHRHGISLASCINIIDTMTEDQEERRYRRNILEQIFNDTYPDSDIKNNTSKHISGALTIFYRKSKTNHGTAKKVFTLIIKWLIRGHDPIIWLTDALMRENEFATMDDSDDIYYYNGEGIYVKGGNVLIKKQIELIFPSATTYQVNETVNHIRREHICQPFRF